MKNRTEQNRTEQNHYCILNDNSLRFSLSQFFNTFNFLSVLFVFAKALSFASASPRERGFEKSATRSGSRQVIYSNLDCFITFAHAVRLSAMTIKNHLVKSFLTSINFDSLSRKTKNPCLVINKKFFNIRSIFNYEKTIFIHAFFMLLGFGVLR